MEIALIAVAALALNMANVLLSKYLAMHIGANIGFAIFLVLLCVTFVAQTGFWVFVGRRWQLSFIYPFLSINYPIAFVLGLYLFGEQFQVGRLVGGIVIATGVAVISLSKHKQEGSVR